MMKKGEQNDLGINPFVGSLKIPVTRIAEPNKFLDAHGTLQPVEYHVERQQFVRVYYTDGITRLVSMLTPSAKSVYLFILYHLESGNDYFVLNRKLFLEQTGTKSVNTLKTGLKELQDKAVIILTTTKDIYWINPKVFFLGNRIIKFPENIEIKSTLTK